MVIYPLAYMNLVLELDIRQVLATLLLLLLFLRKVLATIDTLSVSE